MIIVEYDWTQIQSRSNKKLKKTTFIPLHCLSMKTLIEKPGTRK